MVRPDDQSIPAGAGFLRALTQDDWWKDMGDRVRVCSIAFYVFNSEPGEASCYSDTAAGRQTFGRRFPNDHAARFTAEQARACGFNITRDPEGDEEQSEEHFVLTHANETKRNPYQRDCKRLALLSAFTTRETLAVERCADLSN
jgi:hypothetical protein